MVATRKQKPTDPFAKLPLSPEQREVLPEMKKQAALVTHKGGGEKLNTLAKSVDQMFTLAKYLPQAVKLRDDAPNAKHRTFFGDKVTSIEKAVRTIAARKGWIAAWENFEKTGYVAGVSPAKALLRRRRE